MKKYVLLGLLLWASHAGIAQVGQKRGYTNHTEMGVLLGQVSVNANAPESKASFTATMFNGYRIIPALAVGVTVGADWYRSKMILPISIGIRGDMLKNAKVTPYYSLDVGKGMTWLIKDPTLSYQHGGLHLNPALGIRIATGGGSSLTWSVGYKRQLLTSGTDFSFGEKVANTYAYNRLSIRMGMSF